MGSNQIQNGCHVLAGGFFRKLSPKAVEDLASLQHLSERAGNVTVFDEKTPSHGLYIVLDGEIRLSMSSTDGRRLSLHIARTGDVMGLSSALSGLPYDLTAETLYPARLAYIGRREFLGFLARHPEANQAVIEELSRTVSMAWDQLRTVGLATTASERLARLLLEWSDHNPENGGGSRMRFALTHEEIGEFIGASRETVTRALTTFKLRKLVSFRGSILIIPSRTALADYARA